MCLKVGGGLHGGVSGAGRGLCAFSPGFQGGVGMEISTVVRRSVEESVTKNDLRLNPSQC